MKILQLGKFYPIKGGVEKVMYDLMTGLCEHQINCDMLCASDNSNYQEIKLNDYGAIFAMPSLTKKFGTMISPHLIFRLREIAPQYDIIHIHHPDPMAALALRMSGYRGVVVLHWHSDILKQKHLLKLIMPLQNWLLKRADVVVGTTPVYVKQSPHLKSVQHKVTYFPIGIVPSQFKEETVGRIREKYAGKKIVFSLGRLVEYKGFTYLIDAAKFLSDDYVIIIGGSGPLKEKLELQIGNANLSNKVELLGRISDDDLPDYYAACDLFCLSSVMKTEAFAIVQIEAMSFGKPIVATKIPESGVSWVNADGESGLNVEIRDSEALARAIQKILGDSNLYQKLSKGARDRFKRLFTFDKMIDNCLSIYQSMLND